MIGRGSGRGHDRAEARSLHMKGTGGEEGCSQMLGTGEAGPERASTSGE